MSKARAYLILAHHQPEALLRLLDAVKSPSAHAFVHIDRKTNRGPFDHVLCSRDDCTVVPRQLSVPVYWGGFSVVTATLQLLRLAYYSKQRFQRFALLSGVDLPIKSASAIAERLDGSAEIMRVDRVLDPCGTTDFDRRANRMYLGEHAWLNKRYTKVRFLPGITRIIETWLPNGPYPHLSIFYGPQWWCLTREAVESIFAFIDNRVDVMRWFEHTRCPDEMVFQTILKNSKHRNHISYDSTRGDENLDPTLHGSHFVDWTRPKPDRPATLTIKHLPLLLKSDALFGRKFDSRLSLDLIAALQDTLKSAASPSEERLH